MGNSVFNLTEEIELEKTLLDFVEKIEGKIFMIACFFIFILKMFNIITLYQFLGLFMFYTFWLNCNILYNTSEYSKIEKKISKMD